MAYEQFPEQLRISLITALIHGCEHFAAHWMHTGRQWCVTGKQQMLRGGQDVGPLSEPQTERRTRGRVLPPDSRVEGSASHEKEDRISRPLNEPVEPLQTERRPRRAKTMARREVQSEVNVLPKGRAYPHPSGLLKL
jgi:hypothetical protein